MQITQSNSMPVPQMPQVSANDATNLPALSADFQTFLQMLTVQMQNQDPLNPVDSSDYAVQLATFSSVEQQVLTNELLASALSQMTASGMSQISNWIGKDARVAAPTFYDGRPIRLAPNPVTAADAVELVVRDTYGTEVERISLPVSAAPYAWDGRDNYGNQRPNGPYTFELENFSNGEKLATIPVDSYARVVEATNVGGQTVLILKGDVQVAASDIVGLRDDS